MKILRVPAACDKTGLSRAGLYGAAKRGLMTSPVKIGERASGWPDTEIEAINRAKIAGKTLDEIKVLVRRLEAERTAESEDA